MKDARALLFSIVLLSVGLPGCDTTATQPEPQVVVEAYLQAEAPLPPIRLSRTADVNAAYNPTANAVRDAAVAVDRLAPDSSAIQTVPYTGHDSIPGLYIPADDALVRPQSTYRLRATTSDGTELTSTTTVPEAIELVRTENDTAEYQSDRQPALTIRPGETDVARQSQSVFTFTTTSLLDFENAPDDTLRAALTPFYADGFDAGEDSLRSLRVTSSGLLNEGNFDRNEDGTITVELPWLAVAFLGPNEVAVNVVDGNYYDLLRSQNVQREGLAPGEIPNVIEHVQGGTGIFGSYARAANHVFVCPPGRCP